jgi:hypothetical protein
LAKRCAQNVFQSAGHRGSGNGRAIDERKTMNILQKIRLRYGMRWDARYFTNVLAWGIAIVLMAGAAYRIIAYTDALRAAYYWQHIADVRDKKMASVLNGEPITSLPAPGYKLRNTYFCDVSYLTFGADTK